MRASSITTDFISVAELQRHPADRKIVYIQHNQIEDAVRWVRNGLIRAAISLCPDRDAFAKAAANLDCHSLSRENQRRWGSPKILQREMGLMQDWLPASYGDGTVFFHEPKFYDNTTWMHIDPSIAINCAVVGGLDYLAGDVPASIRTKILNNETTPVGYFEAELEEHGIWADRVFTTSPGDMIVYADLPHRTSRKALEAGFTCNLTYLAL